MGPSGGAISNVALIVGLGNPGPEYQFTPHNVGFQAIDRLAERCGAVVNNRRSKALTGSAQIAGRRVLLVKPETFMNLSGLSVGPLVEEFGANPERDLIVLHDDLAFSLGTIRLRERGSSGGHNGVKSITAALGTEEWLRIRIGTAPQLAIAAESVRQDRKDYVLKPFSRADLAVLDTVLDEVALAVEATLAHGAEVAMNRFNRRSDAEYKKLSET